MSINTEIIRKYLSTVGKDVAEATGELKQIELSTFVDEVHHKTGVAKVWLLSVLEAPDWFDNRTVSHVNDVLGSEAVVSEPVAPVAPVFEVPVAPVIEAPVAPPQPEPVVEEPVVEEPVVEEPEPVDPDEPKDKVED